MARTQGTSVKGLQFLSNIAIAPDRSIAVYVRFRPLDERLVRRGTLLLTYRFGLSPTPCAAPFKVYGDGVLLTIDQYLLPSQPYEAWMNWFANGFEWTCDTTDP